jgi:hypothetical protein
MQALTERVNATVRPIRVGRTILTLLALLLYVPGWLVGMVFVVIAWSFAAAKLGWTDARRWGG